MYEAGSGCIQTKDPELSYNYKSRMYNRDTSASLNHYHGSSTSPEAQRNLRYPRSSKHLYIHLTLLCTYPTRQELGFG
jgi:hypothetical protein